MKKILFAFIVLGLLSGCEKKGVKEQRNLTIRLFYWEDVRTGLCFAYLTPTSTGHQGSNTEVECTPEVRALLPSREPSPTDDVWRAPDTSRDGVLTIRDSPGEYL